MPSTNQFPSPSVFDRDNTAIEPDATLLPSSASSPSSLRIHRHRASRLSFSLRFTRFFSLELWSSSLPAALVSPTGHPAAPHRRHRRITVNADTDRQRSRRPTGLESR
ncbi:hypothetical protein CF326_g9718 [Tilletia indica]|nr:hypothetical protein CF326_g9718 [Tilletia indica]